MTDKEALRQTALKEADNLGQKRRFGLFSQPISTAIGDDGPYKTKFRTSYFMQIQDKMKEKENRYLDPETSNLDHAEVDSSENRIWVN